MGFAWTTLVFETVNFIVLVWILWRVLYRPLRESIEKRREAVRSDLEKAAAARETAEQRERAWAEREKELSSLRERTRREALDEAEAAKSRLLERAREDASSELARVRQLLEAERESARQWVKSAVWERATALAGRLLLALAPGEADRALGDRLVETLERRGEALREELAGDAASEVEICGAHLPDAALVGRIRDVLSRAGSTPSLTTREDASLVAGWTLRVGDRLYDASIAGQLEMFREAARELDAEEASES